MSNERRLFAIADVQQGFFTSRQAIACGYKDSNFARHIASGDWIKEHRGIYRLARYPITQSPDLVLWSLWSIGNETGLRGVISHDTALSVYELSDVNPSKIHMTVPPAFRRRSPVPEILVLHRAELIRDHYTEHDGYWITTPLKTLLDVTADGRISEDLVAQAAREAVARGMIWVPELRSIDSVEAKRLMRFLSVANVQ